MAVRPNAVKSPNGSQLSQASRIWTAEKKVRRSPDENRFIQSDLTPASSLARRRRTNCFGRDQPSEPSSSVIHGTKATQ